MSAQGSTAVTDTTAAVASAGTPLLPAIGTAIILPAPSLLGRSRVSTNLTGAGITLRPPPAGTPVTGLPAGGSVPDHWPDVQRAGSR